MEAPTDTGRVATDVGTAASELKRRALTGFLWTYGTYVLDKGVVFLSLLVLARLIEPAEFGILAFAAAVLAYIVPFADLGMSTALIQRADARDPQIASTVFWLNMAGSIVICAAIWVAAPYVADHGPDPVVKDVLRVIGLVLPLGALASIPARLVEHSLEYRRLFLPSIGNAVGKGAVSIGLAATGFGVWSLVVGQVAGTAAYVIALLAVFWWRPRFVLVVKQIPSLLKFGLGLTALNLTVEFSRNVDYILVGARLGSEALGLYFLAFRLPDMVIGSFTRVAWQVLFPFYARMRDLAPGEEGLQTLARGYVRSVRLGSLLAFPMGFGLAALSTPISLTLFGDKWEGSAAPMALIAIWAAFHGVAGMAGTVYKALGRTALMTVNSLVTTAVLVPALWFAADYGIVWVALAHVGARILTLFYQWTIVSWVLPVPWSLALRNMLPGMTASVVMGAAVYGVAELLPPAAGLAAGIPLGAAVYYALLRLFLSEDLAALVNQARSLRRRRA